MTSFFHSLSLNSLESFWIHLPPLFINYISDETLSIMTQNVMVKDDINMDVESHSPVWLFALQLSALTLGMFPNLSIFFICKMRIVRVHYGINENKWSSSNAKCFTQCLAHSKRSISDSYSTIFHCSPLERFTYCFISLLFLLAWIYSFLSAHSKMLFTLLVVYF